MLVENILVCSVIAPLPFAAFFFVFDVSWYLSEQTVRVETVKKY